MNSPSVLMKYFDIMGSCLAWFIQGVFGRSGGRLHGRKLSESQHVKDIDVDIEKSRRKALRVNHPLTGIFLICPECGLHKPSKSILNIKSNYQFQNFFTDYPSVSCCFMHKYFLYI